MATNKEVEQRIIEMRFQNAQFKSAAGETMKALNSMDTKLKQLGTTADSLNTIGESLDKLDTGALHGLAEPPTM